MSYVLDPSALDMVERLSRASVRSDVSTFYKDAATPTEDTEQGLSTPSSSPPLIPFQDKRWGGLVMHNIALGMLSIVLPHSVYPFLTAYLNMQGTQTLSARTLLALPWCFRPFFRILMDGIPLGSGKQYRLWMVLGWILACGSLVAMFSIDIPKPYFGDIKIARTPEHTYTTAQRATLNVDAPKHGAIYIFFMTMASVGYVFADVAADVLIQDIAKKHFPPPTHDQESPFVARVTIPRYVAMLLTFLFMGFGMSGWHYGGDFDFTLTFNQTMLITAIIAFLPIPCAYFVMEAHDLKRQSVATSLQRIWHLFHNRAIASVLVCRYIGGVLGGISATPVNPIALYWAGVQPMNDNVVSFVATATVIGLIMYAEKKGWVINYRLTIIGANLLVLILDCGATTFAIWNVVRSQWMWIGLPVMEYLPSALDYVILTVMLGEIAEPGTEEVVRSVVAAVSFLAAPFGLTITKYIDARFDLSNDDLIQDTTHVRIHAQVVFVIAYICQLLSIACLWILPRHTEEARDWKLRKNQSSPRTGALLVTMLVLSLAWSIAVHVLSVNESTSCLWIAGGKGC